MAALPGGAGGRWPGREAGEAALAAAGESAGFATAAGDAGAGTPTLGFCGAAGGGGGRRGAEPAAEPADSAVAEGTRESAAAGDAAGANGRMVAR